MPLTKKEYMEFADFLDNLKTYGMSPNKYRLIEYAEVRAKLDDFKDD